MDCVFYDFETTGIFSGEESTAEICRIEAIKCRDNAIIDRFSTFVNVKNRVRESVAEYIGISEESLENAPNLLSAIKSFEYFCKNSMIFGYRTDLDDGLFEYHLGERARFLKDKAVDIYPSVKDQYGELIENYDFDEKKNSVFEKFDIRRKTKKNSLTVENVCRYFGIDKNLSYPEKLFEISVKLNNMPL